MLENLILVPFLTCLALIYIAIFFEVPALLDDRHLPKVQSFALSGKTNDANLRK